MVAALVAGVLVLAAVGGMLVRRAMVVRGVIVGPRFRAFGRVSMICSRGACVSCSRCARERMDRRSRSLQGNGHQQDQQEKSSQQDRHDARSLIKGPG